MKEEEKKREDLDKNMNSIVLYLKKETNVQCPICDSFNISSRGTRAKEFIHANTKEQDVRIKLYSHI